MSLELVNRAIQRAQLRDNDRKWIPQWRASMANQAKRQSLTFRITMFGNLQDASTK